MKPPPSPPNLRETQRAMAAFIMNPLDDEQRARGTLLDGRKSSELAEAIMKPNSRLSSFERLEIYNRQYWFRLIDCLYDDFPGVRAILGDSKFYDVVVAYLQQCPSTSFSLRNLGMRLPQFLQNAGEVTGGREQIAYEMAVFEWAQIEAFDGPMLAPIRPKDFALADPARLHLKLQPYISLLELNYPLDDFLQALRKEHSQRSEAGSEDAPDRSGKPAAKPKRCKTYLAVHRVDNVLYYKRMQQSEFRLLQSLRDGMSLSEACEAALPFIDDSDIGSGGVPDLVRSWFSTWNTLQWFCVPTEKP